MGCSHLNLGKEGGNWRNWCGYCWRAFKRRGRVCGIYAASQFYELVL